MLGKLKKLVKLPWVKQFIFCALLIIFAAIVFHLVPIKVIIDSGSIDVAGDIDSSVSGDINSRVSGYVDARVSGNVDVDNSGSLGFKIYQ